MHTAPHKTATGFALAHAAGAPRTIKGAWGVGIGDDIGNIQPGATLALLNQTLADEIECDCTALMVRDEDGALYCPSCDTLPHGSRCECEDCMRGDYRDIEQPHPVPGE